MLVNATTAAETPGGSGGDLASRWPATTTEDLTKNPVLNRRDL